MALPFPEIKKKLGFGCMRFPMKDGEVDLEQVCRMADLFIERGFNYFDTAHGYIGGRSEKALKYCLTSRYPREKYLLADKLSEGYFKTQKDIRVVFDEQLKICGVDYFDFYLMHAQNRNNYNHYQECNAYETALELKAEGKIRHVGLSFHDKAAVLDKILTDHPQVEFVQLQFNYLDYEDEGVEGRKCYDVCCKHGKPVVVMEPVKGGRLVNLTKAAKSLLDGLNNGSCASYAIRFAAGFENVAVVLSGMSSMAQMEDNVSYMVDFKTLDTKEKAAVEQVCAILRSQNQVPCTACRYCVEGCPKKIQIPDVLACLNLRRQLKYAVDKYREATANGGKASDCVKCGKCEKVCPQHLPIRELLAETAIELES